MTEWIRIRGARQHNLQNCDVDIPRGRLTAVSGVSGSGKSSLVFDTLYAEGQRCYVESLSTYARQFLERLPKPDVDWIDGISPAIAIEQRNAVRSGRSTVGTVTEINDYLRVLFARAGRIYCPESGELVRRDTPESVWRQVRREWPEDTPVLIAYPLATSGAAGWSESLRAQGFSRVLVGDRVWRLDDPDLPQNGGRSEVEVIVDRIKLAPRQRSRFVENVELAFGQSGGSVIIRDRELERCSVFSAELRSNATGRVFAEPTPQLFSFNSPQGACPACNGFGNRLEFAEELIVPEPERNLRDGAVKVWRTDTFARDRAAMLRFCTRRKIPVDRPWVKLTRKQQLLILEGKDRGYTGVILFLEAMRASMEKSHHRFFTRRFMGDTLCRACGGTRLRPEALAVRVSGLTLGQIGTMSVSEARRRVEGLRLTKTSLAVAGEVRDDILHRLKFLDRVGLGYLTLDRPTRTLSGGEAQRIHLANAMGSRLVDTLYVLDEPTTGLHPADVDRLIATLRDLVDVGNTVAVVEHDLAVLGAADYFIELGPGAGTHGGSIVYQGEFDHFRAEADTLTAAYLRGEKRLERPTNPPSGRPSWLRVRGARKHNLRNLDLRLPLQRFVCLTGVSGSGKSSLMRDCLYEGLIRHALGGEARTDAFTSIEGDEYIAKAVWVDQAPIGKSSRSNPATYLQILAPIRNLFAAETESLARGYPPGRFSFNTAGGRCPDCQGMGSHRVEMQFMADITVPCEECRGSRFNPATLEIRYRGLNIAEVLEMTVSDALDFFAGHPEVTERLWLLKKVGLGYLTLGQPATTLSGGESQRLKIARELTAPASRGNIYLLDEPTTGLHVEDVGVLVKVLHELVRKGHTVLVIEHNLDLIAQADWIIDLGPGGGDAGGRVVAQGTPAELAASADSLTGQWLGRRGLAAKGESPR